MKLLIESDFAAEKRDAVEARLAEVGVTPPEGIELVGQQWFADTRSWSVVETDDLVLLNRWLHKWSDLAEFKMTPVHPIEDIAKILAP